MYILYDIIYVFVGYSSVGMYISKPSAPDKRDANVYIDSDTEQSSYIFMQFQCTHVHAHTNFVVQDSVPNCKVILG